MDHTGMNLGNLLQVEAVGKDLSGIKEHKVSSHVWLFHDANIENI